MSRSKKESANPWLGKLTTNDSLDSSLVGRLIDLALDEDLSRGDITSKLCVSSKLTGTGLIIARESMVVSGLPIVKLVVQHAKSRLKVENLVGEGAKIKAGAKLARLQGSVRELLALERTILNFLQRMSGISTLCRQVRKKCPRRVILLDTRKTTPGWRMLEKYAVRIGGATNHRRSLGDLILVKNNHVDANAGNMTKTLSQIYAHKPRQIKVEVEVRNLGEFKAALKFQPDFIMLDNMTNAEIMRARMELAGVRSRPRLEVSGGVSEGRLAGLGKLGIDAVSMGSLTNHAQAVDISMRITPSSRGG